MTTISASQLRQFEPTPDLVKRSLEMPQHSVTMAVGDRSVRCIFEDSEWARLFEEKYADQVISATESSVAHYIMRDALRYLFWSPGVSAWCWDACELPDDAVVFFADSTAVSALLTVADELISFHAAVVGFSNIAAAIAGDSNAGKTTTAVACGRAGLKVYSDERCGMKGRVVVPFARSLHIRGDGWARLQELNPAGASVPADAAPTTEGFNIRLSAMFGQFDPSVTPVLRAVFLLTGSAEQPQLEQVTWAEVAPSLAKGMSSADRGLKRGARLLETLRDAVCFRLRLGSPTESAELIRKTLSAIAE